MTTTKGKTVIGKTVMMTDRASDAAPPPKVSGKAGPVRIWDPLVRVFHWSLVVAFAVVWSWPPFATKRISPAP